jgi:DNA adenine methylase
MPATSTPLRYPGGKTALTGFMQKILEENGFAGGIYAEPFAGGAGLAINLLISGHAKKIVINDLDNAVYSFWYAIVKHPSVIIDWLQNVEVNIDEWIRQRKIYKSNCSGILEKGFATLFLNRCNRSGILSANPIGGINQTGSYSLTARFNKELLVSKIERIGSLANRIEVRNEDALKIIHLLGQRKCANKTFVFLDPPYFVKGSALYMNHFKSHDHLNLAQSIKKSLLSWMVTYDDVPQTRLLYQTHQLIPFDLNYTAFAQRNGKEILVLKNGLKIPSTSIAANYPYAINLKSAISRSI